MWEKLKQRQKLDCDLSCTYSLTVFHLDYKMFHNLVTLLKYEYIETISCSKQYIGNSIDGKILQRRQLQSWRRNVPEWLVLKSLVPKLLVHKLLFYKLYISPLYDQYTSFSPYLPSKNMNYIYTLLSTWKFYCNFIVPILYNT